MAKSNKKRQEATFTQKPRPNLKISDDPALDEIVLDLSPEQEVIDHATRKPIPGLTRRGFSFSCPYRIADRNIYPARPVSSRSFFYTGLSQKATKPEVKTIGAEQYTEQYLRHAGHLDDRAKIVFLEVKPALYTTPQQPTDGGAPLNAFEVRGVLYRLNDDYVPDLNQRKARAFIYKR
ncbi:hypothetical protein HYU19_01425 [Candidatus Woesearchaeota archaeon]|nr:hypothetical protein [Candidatus Woesearchaeota archaeon]